MNINLNSRMILYIGILILLIGVVLGIRSVFKGEIRNSIIYVVMSMLIAIFLNSFNIPSFNNQLGFREISKNGIELSKKTNINKFATLDMGRTENMSVYLNTEIIKIRN